MCYCGWWLLLRYDCQTVIVDPATFIFWVFLNLIFNWINCLINFSVRSVTYGVCCHLSGALSILADFLTVDCCTWCVSVINLTVCAVGASQMRTKERGTRFGHGRRSRSPRFAVGSLFFRLFASSCHAYIEMRLVYHTVLLSGGMYGWQWSSFCICWHMNGSQSVVCSPLISSHCYLSNAWWLLIPAPCLYIQ